MYIAQLVKGDAYNPYILELENHINNNKIELLTHELIIEEWNKHKKKIKKDRERKLLPNNKKDASNSNDLNNLVPEKSFKTTDHLALQIAQIDTLLSKAKHILKTPEGIKNEFADRFRQKLAPFHTKKDSQNDWKIIGTICNHCDNYDINDVYFLSYNHTDFADENETYRTINPSLQSRFLKVKSITLKIMGIFSKNWIHF